MHVGSGELRGRKLLSPPSGAVTRPITGLVRKSLFDRLRGRIEGGLVLDLYCGTGTLGIEALSRGAGQCCFAEHDRAVLDRLRRNIEALDLVDRSRIWRGDLTRRLAARLGGLDSEVAVAFVDPPYADTRRWDWARVDRTVLAPLTERLAEDGVIVLRTPTDIEVPAVLSVTVQQSRRYGGMTVTFLGRAGQ